MTLTSTPKTGGRWKAKSMRGAELARVPSTDSEFVGSEAGAAGAASIGAPVPTPPESSSALPLEENAPENPFFKPVQKNQNAANPFYKPVQNSS